MPIPLCSLQLAKDSIWAEEYLHQGLKYLRDPQATVREEAVRFTGEPQPPGCLSGQLPSPPALEPAWGRALASLCHPCPCRWAWPCSGPPPRLLVVSGLALLAGGGQGRGLHCWEHAGEQRLTELCAQGWPRGT